MPKVPAKKRRLRAQIQEVTSKRKSLTSEASHASNPDAGPSADPAAILPLPSTSSDPYSEEVSSDFQHYMMTLRKLVL